MDINKISTEKRNEDTKNIDIVSTIEMLEMINKEDQKVAIAVENQKQNIAKAIDLCFEAIRDGGRVVYIGAGTSGRLGILDASEIFPTFGESKLFVGLIAGGEKAIRSSVESAEDNENEPINDLEKINFSKKDVLVGIAASGRTPYVVFGINYANSRGAKTISISTAKNSDISKLAIIPIEVVVGAETIMGSTRMKSGTAQKMILNSISTGVMVKLGKTFSNIMVDLKPTNEKLIERAINMIKFITKTNYKESKELFQKSKGNVKIAIVMHYMNLSYLDAKEKLILEDGILRKVVNIKI